MTKTEYLKIIQPWNYIAHKLFNNNQSQHK